MAERLQGVRDLRVRRMGFAPVTCPTTPALEDLFYPNARTIAAAARDLVEGPRDRLAAGERTRPAKLRVQGAVLMIDDRATAPAGLDWPLMKNNIAPRRPRRRLRLCCARTIRS